MSGENRSHTTNLGGTIESGLPNITGSVTGFKVCTGTNEPKTVTTFNVPAGAITLGDADVYPVSYSDNGPTL